MSLSSSRLLGLLASKFNDRRLPALVVAACRCGSGGRRRDSAHDLLAHLVPGGPFPPCGGGPPGRGAGGAGFAACGVVGAGAAGVAACGVASRRRRWGRLLGRGRRVLGAHGKFLKAYELNLSGKLVCDNASALLGESPNPCRIRSCPTACRERNGCWRSRSSWRFSSWWASSRYFAKILRQMPAGAVRDPRRTAFRCGAAVFVRSPLLGDVLGAPASLRRRACLVVDRAADLLHQSIREVHSGESGGAVHARWDAPASRRAPDPGSGYRNL